jgi:hypothetical protein
MPHRRQQFPRSCHEGGLVAWRYRVRMRASRSLPEGYVYAGTLRFHGNNRLLRTLTLLTIPATILSFVLLGQLSALVRPAGWTFDTRNASAVAIIATVIGGLAATVVIALVLHEAVHGVVLWAITGARPVFGFKGWYAFADAPGWYLSRGQMVATYLAPFVVLPAIGLPLVAVAPAGLSLFIFLGLVVNAVGAVGDLYSTVFVLRIKGPVIFGDGPDDRPGESGSWFVPAATA